MAQHTQGTAYADHISMQHLQSSCVNAALTRTYFHKKVSCVIWPLPSASAHLPATAAPASCSLLCYSRPLCIHPLWPCRAVTQYTGNIQTHLQHICEILVLQTMPSVWYNMCVIQQISGFWIITCDISCGVASGIARGVCPRFMFCSSQLAVHSLQFTACSSRLAVHSLQLTGCSSQLPVQHSKDI